MDWDFTKLEIQENTHLSALASSSSSGSVIHHHPQQQHHHHHHESNLVDNIFSVDLKLGRVMDDQNHHHRHHHDHYGMPMEATFNPNNYPCAPQPTMTLMEAAAAAAASPPLLQGSHSTRRGRGGGSGGGGGGSLHPVCCLVDGCNSDLSNCREYHRRHRVCERHSKTPVVLVGGEEQRFCQQCSRFHPLCEFDEVKRSCRKRLDGHNRRRRKTQPDPALYNINSSTTQNTNSMFTPTCSPGSALMDFIRSNAPHLPHHVFPPPQTLTPWRSQVDFLLPSSSSSSPPSSYPFMPYGFGDQITRQQRAPNSIMSHQMMTTNHTQQPPPLDNSSTMTNDNNINCALSLLSSAPAMDTNTGANRSSTSSPAAGINPNPYGGLLVPDHHHHHLFSSHAGQLPHDLDDGANGSYGGVVFHHSAAGGTHDHLHQRNHGFGHSHNSDGF